MHDLPNPLTGDVSLSGSNRVRGVRVGRCRVPLHPSGIYGRVTPIWIRRLKIVCNGTNVFDGNQMKFISKQSFNVWTTYKVLPELTLGAGATLVGKRFVDDANELKLRPTGVTRLWRATT